MKNVINLSLIGLAIVSLSFTSCKKETLETQLPDQGIAFKQPVAVDLSIGAFFTGPSTTAGTFTSSGFLNTTGTTTEDIRLTSQTYHGQTTFTDASGSFTAVVNGQWGMTSPSTASGSGNWNIINGTGNYAQLKGNGQMTFTVDFATGAVNDSWTGAMHIK